MTYCKTLAVVIVAAMIPLSKYHCSNTRILTVAHVYLLIESFFYCVDSKLSCFVEGVQDVAGELDDNIFSDDAFKIKDSIFNGSSLFGSRDLQIGNTVPESTGGKNFFGSRNVQIGNDYSGIPEGKVLFGSEDVQIGNTYPENPQGTNMYGPTLIQRGNVYRGNGIDGKIFGPKVTQVGNTYPKTSGKGETYGPVVIQDGNVYSFKNLSGNHQFGAVVNQTNNIYPKAVDGNSELLKPIIIQKGNVFHDFPDKKSADFHPTEGYETAAGPSGDKINRYLPTLVMMKRQHEGIMKIIDFHIRSDKSSSKRCADGMMDSERLDRIVTLKKDVEAELVLLKALVRIDRNRKVICDSLQDLCERHDEMRKWISSTKSVLATKTAKSRETWKSLWRC